jgi:tetratricopeptide (TPR) repeat protein
MRAWPGNFDGLRLRLSSGWYSIPSYVSADERRRLCEVLIAGVAEIDHVVELDWDTLDEAAAKLHLTRSLVFVRVPAKIEPDGDALERVRAILGSVRLGLLQYEAPGVWADIAWQEREVKVPLLTWLKRWLRDPTHPFAKLGSADLPVDEIAKLTAEPAELLIGVEKILEHRLRYRRQGMAREDWIRSVMHVAAERLAGRLMQIPAELRSRALDLAMFDTEESAVVPALTDYDAGVALAHVGLAWHGGNDLLLGPLVRLLSEAVVLQRLLELLPGAVWSATGKSRARRGLQVFLPPPRATIIAPEFPYSTWPAISPALALFAGFGLESSSQSTLGQTLRQLDWVRGFISALLERPDIPRNRRAAMDASLNMLDEIEDEQLLDRDFERGQIHRFDAIDRAWAQLSGGAEAHACLRWIGLTRLLGRVNDSRRLDVLLDEADRTLELVDRSSLVAAAIYGLKGDILAQQSRYRAALVLWEEAGKIVSVPQPRERLAIRRSLAAMRLDEESGAWESSVGLNGGHVVDELAGLLFVLRRIIDVDPQRRPVDKIDVDFGHDGDRRGGRRTITRVAAALEYGEWPYAINLVRTLEYDTNTPEGLRAAVLRAWIRASLGDLDRANACFDDVRALATERGDLLAEAFAHRGLAAVAYLRNHTEPAIASLEAALNIERELELPDADLLELELTGWRALAGQLPITDYSAKLVEYQGRPSASFEFARLDSFLRFLASSRALIETSEAKDLSEAVQPIVDTLEKCIPVREHSIWVPQAREVAVELADRLGESNLNALASNLLDVTRRIELPPATTPVPGE